MMTSVQRVRSEDYDAAAKRAQRKNPPLHLCGNEPEGEMLTKAGNEEDENGRKR
jgi:hypothetical protein